MKNIELWDDSQNHILGTLSDDNKVELSSNDRDFIRGKLENNHFELNGHRSLHLWGFLDGNHVELWDDQLHHLSGEIT
jgi:hypothetical protein